MPRSLKPVVVFHGRNEMEAQMARDLLASSMLPVIHLPSPATGIFGAAETTRVAVPSEYAEEAVRLLREAGFESGATDPARGLRAIQEGVAAKLPRPEGSGLPEQSSLRRVLVGLLVAIGVLILLAVFLRSSPPAP